jgi:lactate 2-monooxygenase
MTPFGNYKDEIYSAGLEGVLPQFPVDYRTLEARAAGALPPSVFNHVQSGCGDETTQIRNVEAFGHWGMTPRMMVDCSKRDLSIELSGLKLPSPLFMAPIGVTGLCTQDSHGDLAAARASVLTRVPMMATIVS